jgi:hypothetical protein
LRRADVVEIDDIRSLVLCLAADESRLVNGAAIAIGGGENNLRADS